MREIEQLHSHVESAANGFGGFVAAYEKGLKAVSRGDRVPYDWRSPSQTVRRFLNGDFSHLCQSLELLKTIDCDEYAGQFAETLSNTMLQLGEVTASEWRRFGVTLRRDFTWSAQILLAVFKPMSFCTKRMPKAFVGRVSPQAFRRQVIDRILVVLRGLLTRLRDYAQLIDQQIERFPLPDAVTIAGMRGLLMARLSDGRYDYVDARRCLTVGPPLLGLSRQQEKVDMTFARLRRYLRLVGRMRVAGEYSL